MRRAVIFNGPCPAGFSYCHRNPELSFGLFTPESFVQRHRDITVRKITAHHFIKKRPNKQLEYHESSNRVAGQSKEKSINYIDDYAVRIAYFELNLLGDPELKLRVTDSRGGIGIDSGSPVITNCRIVNNTCGIYSSGGGAVIKNNLITDNDNGLIFSYPLESATVRNNTITDNFNYGVYAVGENQPLVSNSVLWYNWDDLFGSQVLYSCVEDVNDANGTGNITSDPCFVNVFDFIDETDTNGTKTTIVVADANLYDVNDIIEYDNDAIARTVTGINTTTKVITFAGDQLDSNSLWGVDIHNWGIGVTDVNEDYHLDPNSLCIDAGDPNAAYTGEVDIDFADRVIDGDNDSNSVVDIGADEYDPNS